MFKAIKITADNKTAIEAALAAVNGRANQHAYTTYTEIEEIAEGAEAKLKKLGIPVAMRGGAAWAETSGGSVANAYAKISSSRKATFVRLVRKSSDWFLEAVSAAAIYKEGGGPGRLTLTAEQAAKAIEVFSKQFTVAKPAETAA